MMVAIAASDSGRHGDPISRGAGLPAAPHGLGGSAWTARLQAARERAGTYGILQDAEKLLAAPAVVAECGRANGEATFELSFDLPKFFYRLFYEARELW